MFSCQGEDPRKAKATPVFRASSPRHRSPEVSGIRPNTDGLANQRVGVIRGDNVLDATPSTPHTRTRAAARRVVIVAYDGVQALDVTGSARGVRRRRRASSARRTGTPAYDVDVVALEPGAVRTESGLQLVAGPRSSASARSTR